MSNFSSKFDMQVLKIKALREYIFLLKEEKIIKSQKDFAEILDKTPQYINAILSQNNDRGVSDKLITQIDETFHNGSKKFSEVIAEAIQEQSEESNDDLTYEGESEMETATLKAINKLKKELVQEIKKLSEKIDKLSSSDKK